jgi:predicted PurR-regulated permease PerM
MMTTGERGLVTTLILYALVGLLAYLMYLVVRPFLVPLAWAGVLVIFFYPLHTRLRARYGRSRAAVLSTGIVTLILIVPALLILPAFLLEAGQAFTRLSASVSDTETSWVKGTMERLQQYLPAGLQFDVSGMVTQVVQQAAAWLAALVGALLQNFAAFLLYPVIAIFAAFFIFRDADTVMRAIRDVLPLDPALRERLIAQTGEVVRAAVVSSFIVAGVQGMLGGLTFWALGLTAPVFWGVVMAVFCLLPLGAWIVWLPAAIWLMATGHVARGIVLIAVGAGIVSAVDNFLRPLLLAGRTKLNGLLMFISLLGGVSAFGILGIMLGPVIVATAVGLFEAYMGEVEKGRAV